MHALKVTTSYYEDYSDETYTRLELRPQDTHSELVDVEPAAWMVDERTLPGLDQDAVRRGIVVRTAASHLDALGTTQRNARWYSSPDGARPPMYASDVFHVEDIVTLEGFTPEEADMVAAELERILRERDEATRTRRASLPESSYADHATNGLI